jgi:hypothetical protein
VTERDEAIGSAAEEAFKLFAALADLGSDQTDEADQADPTGQAGDPGPTGEDCRWCPVCRLAHAVRRTSPEVRDHLSAAAASLLRAASAFLAESSASGTPDADPRSRVEKIDPDGSEED